MSAAETLAAMTLDELIAVVTRGLNADEQAAREADNRRWLIEDNTISLWPEREDDGFMSFPTRADARHAYRHDPARVLADVESKREILARYERAAAVPASVAAFVRGQDDGYRQACLDALRDLARPYLDREAP